MLHNKATEKKNYVSPALAKFEFSTQDVVATSANDFMFATDKAWTTGVTIDTVEGN
ncbi:MAG: hypothetical protein J6B56_03690 [Clostridia bacterium]|nr:hypothetical protein [Clostridia bacterium]